MNATCKVYSGDDCLLSLKNYCSGKIFLLVDENTQNCSLPLFFEKSGISSKKIILIEIRSGEQNKNLDTCRYIWKTLTDKGAERRSVLINLGGGVITDMGGYAAACFKRGIKFINIPTTLMAQLDASIGGKTGINLDHLKNQIGVFRQPEAVFINTDFLKTLPQDHIISGFAEALKYALIYDNDLWQKLKAENICNKTEWYDIISRCVKIKTSIVEKDPFENDLRRILNFGHTIGHAIETLSHKMNKPILHGEAVAIGLAVETMISSKVLGLNKDIKREIFRVIRLNYDLKYINESEIPDLITIMMHDKKNADGRINFTLIEDIGKARIDQFCDSQVIEESLIEYIH